MKFITKKKNGNNNTVECIIWLKSTYISPDRVPQIIQGNKTDEWEIGLGNKDFNDIEIFIRVYGLFYNLGKKWF